MRRALRQFRGITGSVRARQVFVGPLRFTLVLLDTR
jgi:hypothetical protein